MESKGTPGRINISEATKVLLESLETSNYHFEQNILIELESLGIDVNSYFLNYDFEEEKS